MSIISIIVAVDDNNAIGKDGGLLCHLPADMKYFREHTMGHTIIMGRKTFASLRNGALPGRRNIVISGNPALTCDGALVCGSLAEALQRCDDEDEVFIIGGASVYRQALPLATKIYLTRIRHKFDDADTFFPEINPDEWTEISRKDCKKDEKNTFDYSFLIYLRKN